MNKPERTIQNNVRKRLSKIGVTNFRNNVGVGWVGKILKILTKRTVVVYPGDVVVRQARPLHAGLCEGSTDIIALKKIIITKKMVGKEIAVFVAPEVKTEKGRSSPKQKNFQQMVIDHGGISGEVRSEQDAEDLISEYIKNLKL